MYPKRPASSRASITCSPVIVLTSFWPKSANVCTSSAFTFTQSTFLRSPRTMEVTVPLTGDANFTSGWFLFTNSASPAFTWSPSLTTTFGVIPTKQPGTSPYSSAFFREVLRVGASPSRCRSKPLRNLMIFTIVVIYNVFPIIFFVAKLTKKEQIAKKKRLIISLNVKKICNFAFRFKERHV